MVPKFVGVCTVGKHAQNGCMNYVKAYGCDLVIKNKVSSKQVPGEVFVCSAKGLQLILTKEHFKTIRRE